jgi:hypothetical protein
MVSGIAQASSVFTSVLVFLTCFIHNLVISAVVLPGVLCMKVGRQPYMC